METPRAAILGLRARPLGRLTSGLALPCLPPARPCWPRRKHSERLPGCGAGRPAASSCWGSCFWTIFHYQSVAYPAVVGTFRDRILWVGNIAKGDASIAIRNLTMNDNGTFTCAVKNPPDVHHNIPQTKLTVTQRGFSFQLTSAVLLSILVFLPSAIVVILLLVRMGRKFGVLKHRKKSGYKKSSIEVSDEPERTEQGTCLGRMGTWCLQCVDTDEEEPY
ncbi:myelin protein zero-like protein 3 isoform X4 [Dermochelys coriacea]|uniref:myelin protein zero-like protein 3 isoform X4 n=1 Tax=Dermochelys coriacea TaxID=27794 RepID=UPI001CA9E901|nr:myelin protein zero-like protein 3 isoform X4 [Dermochelys coriacea]